MLNVLSSLIKYVSVFDLNDFIHVTPQLVLRPVIQLSSNQNNYHIEDCSLCTPSHLILHVHLNNRYCTHNPILQSRKLKLGET